MNTGLTLFTALEAYVKIILIVKCIPYNRVYMYIVIRHVYARSNSTRTIRTYLYHMWDKLGQIKFQNKKGVKTVLSLLPVQIPGLRERPVDTMRGDTGPLGQTLQTYLICEHGVNNNDDDNNNNNNNNTSDTTTTTTTTNNNNNSYNNNNNKIIIIMIIINI